MDERAKDELQKNADKILNDAVEGCKSYTEVIGLHYYLRLQADSYLKAVDDILSWNVSS